MNLRQTHSHFPIPDPINLTPKPANWVASSAQAKWQAGSLFILIKRGGTPNRSGGSHSGPTGYKARRQNYFRGKGVVSVSKH